jgi:pilus assembly protein TadC
VSGRWARAGTSVLVAVSLAWVVGGWVGLVAAVVVGPVVYRYLGRLEPAAVRRSRLRAAADLPYAADLLAAVLRAGQPTDRAVRLVGDVLGGPVGERLARVGRSLALGLTPGQAWTALADLPGGERLTAAVTRSAESGAALAAAFARLADDQRAARAATVEAAVRRTGVLIVLPLGLCFLPAFVFAGVVPVIVAVLGDVLR